MPAVPLALVKQYLDVTTSDQDDELIDTIDQAEAILAQRVGLLSPTTVTDEVHTGPGPLLLRRYPVLSVTSVTSNGAPVGDVDLDPDTGRVFGSFGYWPRGVRVTYTTGRPTPLPWDLERAVLEMVDHLWETQRVPMQGGRPGFSDADLNPEVSVGSRFLLPYRVQTLIEPYLVKGMA